MTDKIEALAERIYAIQCSAMAGNPKTREDIATTIRAHFAGMAGVLCSCTDAGTHVGCPIRYGSLVIDNLTTALAAARARIAELEAGRNGET